MDNRGCFPLTKTSVDLSKIFAENHTCLLTEANALWDGRKSIPLGQNVSDKLHETGELIAE